VSLKVPIIDLITPFIYAYILFLYRLLQNID